MEKSIQNFVSECSRDLPVTSSPICARCLVAPPTGGLHASSTCGSISRASSMGEGVTAAAARHHVPIRASPTKEDPELVLNPMDGPNSSSYYFNNVSPKRGLKVS